MTNRLFKSIITIILGIFSLLSIYPLAWMTINSFRGTTEITTGNSFGLPKKIIWDNYIGALFERNIIKYFANSILITAMTILLTVIISTMLAYALTRMFWKLRSQVTIIITLGILLPSQIVIVPVFIIVRQLHLIDNPFALILSISAFNITMCTLIAMGFLKSIPIEMEEAGVIDGSGLLRIFIKIILPMLKPAIATMCVNIFLNSWNEFIYSLTLLSSEKFRTLPVGLMSYAGRYGTDFGGMFAAMVITSIIPITVYIIFSEQVEKALTAGAILK